MEFTTNNILLDCLAVQKKELLRIISDYAKEYNFVDDANKLFDDFIVREEKGATGLQEGFAIPHAKSSVVKNIAILYARNKTILKDWESFDGQGVQHVFALLVPTTEQYTKHIEIISTLATALLNDDFKEKVSTCMDEQGLADIIKKEMLKVTEE